MNAVRVDEPMRIPPNALEAERDLLGSVLVDGNLLDVVSDHIRDPEEFYSAANGQIFAAMRALQSRSQPIDCTTVRTELARTGKLAAVGGDEYLFSLTNVLPITDHVEAYARLVSEKATVRRLIASCHQIAAEGYADYGSLESYRDRAEAAIFSIVSSSAANDGPQLVDVKEMLQDITDASSGKVNPNGRTTGIRALDDFTTGAHPGDVIVIAGRPGMGKSALAMGALFASAEETRLPALYFSMEMQKRKCRRRLLSMLSGVDGSAIKKGRVSDDGWRHIARAAQRIEATKFMIDAQPGISLPEIRGRARRIAAEHGGLAGIAVDYLQLMEGAGDEHSREREVAKISRGLKMLAMEIDCPIYELSQLNRSCEERPDKRPQVSDLRESGAIEQDADCIWLLYRRGYYAAQMAKEENQAPQSKFKPRCTIEPGEDDGKGEVIVGKQRDGSPGVVRLRFEGPCTRYVDNDFVQPRGIDPYAHIGGSLDDGSGDGEPYQQDEWYP